MKILVLASWFRAGAGGAFVHLSEIYKRLPHEIMIVGDREPGDAAADARLPWRVLRVPIGTRLSKHQQVAEAAGAAPPRDMHDVPSGTHLGERRAGGEAAGAGLPGRAQLVRDGAPLGKGQPDDAIVRVQRLPAGMSGERQLNHAAVDARQPGRAVQVPAGVRRSLGKLNTAVSLWRGYREVDRIVAAERPDLIHAGHYLPWGIYAERLRRKRGIPYALFTWGEDVLAAESDGLRQRAMERTARGARWLFTNSEFTTAHLQGFVAPGTPIRTIFGGADLERFRPGLPGDIIRKRLGLEDRLILLSVGALRPQQGVDQLLGAVARLAGRFPNIHYVIAGKGFYKEHLRGRAAELGIINRVTFAGYVPDGELPLYYAACDVFALLHRRVEETGEEMCFGLVFLEAGACGKPVVGSRLGGTHFAICDGETGFLVEPNCDAAADDRLAALLGDAELRARLGAQARRWIEGRFSWDRAAQLVREAHGW